MLGVLVTVSWAFNPGARAQAPAIKFDVSAAKGDPRLTNLRRAGTRLAAQRTACSAISTATRGSRQRSRRTRQQDGAGPDRSGAAHPVLSGTTIRRFRGRRARTIARRPNVTWTLTANGQTFSIPVSLDPLYLIQPQRDEAGTYPGNTPPTIKFDPSGQSAQGPAGITVSRSATVSRPLTLEVWVTDDGLPPQPGAKGPAPALRGSPGGRPRRGAAGA